MEGYKAVQNVSNFIEIREKYELSININRKKRFNTFQ